MHRDKKRGNQLAKRGPFALKKNSLNISNMSKQKEIILITFILR